MKARGFQPQDTASGRTFRERVKIMTQSHFSRRGFIKATAATDGAVSLFHIVPRAVLGGPGNNPPSNRITRGVIGTGNQGMTHVTGARDGNSPTLAVCDVDKDHLGQALGRTGPDAKGYADWRDVIDRKDIDTIHVGTPPHWHALISIAAMQAGKDVFSEKPMTRFLAEGPALIKAVERYGRVYTINTYARPNFRDLKRLVDTGFLGTPVTCLVSPTTRYGFKVHEWSGKTNQPPEPVPQALDYDMWLGPAPFKPYFRHRTHMSFRGYWDYDGGGLADMGQHWLDRIQYVLGKDHDSPVEVEAKAAWPAHPDAVGLWGSVDLKYADGTKIILETGEWGDPIQPNRPYFEGPKGKIWGGDNKADRTDPPEMLAKLNSLPELPRPISFEDAVKTRVQPTEHPDVWAAHRSITLIHLANAAIRTGRKLKFDPEAQQFVNDPEANLLLNVPMRAPWHL